jgi:hypothetical protein
VLFIILIAGVITTGSNYSYCGAVLVTFDFIFGNTDPESYRDVHITLSYCSFSAALF